MIKTVFFIFIVCGLCYGFDIPTWKAPDTVKIQKTSFVYIRAPSLFIGQKTVDLIQDSYFSWWLGSMKEKGFHFTGSIVMLDGGLHRYSHFVFLKYE